MIEQGSPEWHSERVGKVTASRVADLLARTKQGWGAPRNNYRAQLVAERLSGVPADCFVSAAMQRGTDLESEARNAYAFYHGVDVVEVGFVAHPTIDQSGASPDGLVGDDGLVEIKCPLVATHIETLLQNEVPEKYRHQMLWQMACTGRQWCDFVSYCPELPEDMRLFVRRVERSEEVIAHMELAVQIFLREIDDTVNRLVARFRSPEAAEQP